MGVNWVNSKYVIIFQKTANGGTNWTTSQLPSNYAYAYAIDVDPNDYNKIYVGGFIQNGSRKGVVFKSVNGGSTWTELGTNDFGNYNNILSLAIDHASTNTVYAGSSYGMYKSTNGGQSWTKISNKNVQCIKIHPKSSKKIFYGSYDGVYYTPDAGSTWGLMQAGLNIREIGCLEFNSNAKYLFAGTRGGSVARYATKKMKTPKKPKLLKAKALNNRQIKLTWKDTSTNEEGVKIERRLGTSGSWAEIRETGPNEKAYIDTVNTANTIFQYRVRSFNAFGTSGYSNLAKVKSK